MPDFPNISTLGWTGYLGMAIVIALNYLPKIWKESRGEDREAERLTAALNDERNMRKEAEKELKDARAHIFQQVADFAKMNAENATLAERMTHMIREQERLSTRNEELALTVDRQNKQIELLTEQLHQLQSKIENPRG